MIGLENRRIKKIRMACVSVAGAGGKQRGKGGK